MARDNIKGINVVIGGETTGLNNALKEVNKTAGGLQSELKQVERLLKLDPQNTELLAQKQKLLTEAVQNTTEKLKALKEAEAQVQKQVKEGSVSETQYRALQREIIKTEQELKGFETRAQKTKEEIKSLGKNIEVAADSTGELKEGLSDAASAIGGLGMTAGTATVALGVTAFKGANDFKGALNDIVAATGKADDETTGFSDTLKNIYANNYGESYEDIANAMSLINQQTGLTGEALERTTTNALILRDTFDFEVNESMRSAEMLVNQFGISSEEAYGLIAQGAQNGLNKNEDLLDTINEYSVHFKQMGFTSEEMFNMLVSGTENGTYSVDKLGDAIKEFGIRAKDGSSTTVEAFELLGLDADEMTLKFAQGGEAGKEAFNQVTTALFNLNDPMVQNTAGVNLFGSMWEDLGAQGVKALTETTDAINLSSDALAQISEVKYDTPIEALQGLGRTIETDIILPMGERLMPQIEEVIETIKKPEVKESIKKVVDQVGDLIELILQNSPTVISAIGAIATGFMAWKVGSIIQGVVDGVKAFQLANEGAAIAQGLLNVAIGANPIGAILMLIVGLITGIVLLWNTNEDFRNAIIGIWEAILEAGKKVWEVIGKFFAETIPEAASGLAKSVLEMKDNIVEYFTELPIKIGEAFTNVLTAISEWGKNTLEWIVTEVPKFIEKIVFFYFTLPIKIAEALAEVVKKLISWINDMVQSVKQRLPAVITQIVNGFSGLPRQMVDIGKNIISGIWEGISSMMDWINGKVESFVSSMVSKMKNVLKIQSPSRVLADEVGKFMAQGIGMGFEDEMTSVSNNMALAIPTGKSDYLSGGSGASSSSASFSGSTIEHSGVIRVEGVNSKRELMGVIDLVMDELRRSGRR